MFRAVPFDSACVQPRAVVLHQPEMIAVFYRMFGTVKFNANNIVDRSVDFLVVMFAKPRFDNLLIRWSWRVVLSLGRVVVVG